MNIQIKKNTLYSDDFLKLQGFIYYGNELIMNWPCVVTSIGNQAAPA